MKQGGFTIVELLIVIVVIGVLATIGVVSYGGAQDRARAAAIAEKLSNIKDAFSLYGAKEQTTTWPYEDTFGQGANPTMNSIVANTSLGNYMETLDPVPGYPNSAYIYDNDSTDPDEAFDDCGQTLDGVNIRISNTEQQLAQVLDNTIDDGDLNCGQVRWITADNMIKYILSETRNLE